MHAGRTNAAVAVLVDGSVLAIGGDSNGNGTAEIYNPRTRTWRKVDDPPVGFARNSEAFRLGNSRVFVIAEAQDRDRASVASYDTELGWLPLPNLPTGATSGFAVALADPDNVLVAGGERAQVPIADAAIYNARADTWTVLPKMSSSRAFALAAPLGNRLVLVTSGVAAVRATSQPVLDSAEIFDPASGWRPAAAPGLQGIHQLLPLGVGKVLAFGSPGALAVYDLASNRWSPAAPVPLSGLGPAVLMADGRVLAAGGVETHGVGQARTSRILADAALYNPANNSWSSLQALGEARYSELLAALPDGSVLAAGGFGKVPTSLRSPALRTTEVFGGPAVPGQARPASDTLPEQGWILAGIALLIGGLAIFLGFARRRRPSRLGLGLGRLALQAGGVVVATWGLFYFAHLLVSTRTPGGAISNFFYEPLGQVLWEGALRSLTLIAYAIAGATAVGLGTAIAVVSLRERRLVGIELAGAVLLVLPTFLLAILVQELQAFIFGKTGLIVAAGYGDVNAVQIFWASLVLGLRPATYLYRHARVVLERETSEDYVRTAEAKGLEWSGVVRHHLLRAGGSALVATWSNAFRLMIGSLPLVEYFFGYPGLGRILVQSIGIHYDVRPTVVRGDIAIGLVVLLALILILAETAAGGLQRWLDPRLRAVRAAA
jgi:ABC-type dipeptide/oligopeptide/nickel transport system permease component